MTIDSKALAEAVADIQQYYDQCKADELDLLVVPFDSLTVVLTALEERTEALQQIKTVGTKTVYQRVGDMYAENGWQNFTTISAEAAIAARVLGGHNEH